MVESKMTQAEAIKQYREELGLEMTEYSESIQNCTGDISNCPNDECLICGIRDCPRGEALHYHHDGCPACYQDEKDGSK